MLAKKWMGNTKAKWKNIYVSQHILAVRTKEKKLVFVRWINSAWPGLHVDTLVICQTFRKSKLKQTFKPIYSTAKPLLLGSRVGLDSQHNVSMLPIPTCCYPKSLANPTRPPVYPTLLQIYPIYKMYPKPTRFLVEYRNDYYL